MRQLTRRLAVLGALLFGIAANPALAGTTGNIIGVATDASGGVMPGVTIEASSPALQGTKVAVTGADGSYRFQFVPPGTYKVRATLAGFRTVERSGVVVNIDSNLEVGFKLEPSLGTEIVVEDTTPLIDQRSAKGGANFTEELFNSLPVQRNYTAVVALTPGASTDGSGTTFYGSTGPENSYIIDGVNTTSVGFGTQGKNLNFDFIKEVEVKSSGYEAEFGRATGGIINVITKNGGNEYHGDGFGYWSGRNLGADACDECLTRAGEVTGFDEMDFGGDVGGYIMKDKLWFFAAVNPTFRNEYGVTPLTTDPASLSNYLPREPGVELKLTDSGRFYMAGKATWNINAANNAVLSIFGDPQTDTTQPRLADEKADAERERGGIDYTAKINSVLNPSLYVDVQAALHQEKNTVLPADGDLQSSSFLHRLTGVRQNGFGRWQDYGLSRWSGRGNFTGFSGNHEFKFGGDFEQLVYDAKSGYSGDGFWWYRNPNLMRRDHYFRWDADGNPVEVDTLEARTTTFNMAAYVQDKWSIQPNLVLSAGLRWDKQSVNDYEGITRIRLDNNWAPRFGLTWDPSNQGKWKVFGSAGRFFESIPLDLNNRALGAEGSGFEYWSRVPSSRDPNANFGRQDAGVKGVLDPIYLGGTVSEVDPALKGQHIDEFTAGAEYEIIPKLALGIKGIYREIGDVIEDVSVDDGAHYFIANPGQGAAQTGIDSEGNPVAFVLPERTFKGLEFTMNKRLSNRWQVFASYLWGKLEGNYEGLFTSSNGQLDPNITSAFDIPTLLPNRYGPLPQDRRHTVKIDGSYEFAFKLSVGSSLRYTSGSPISTLGAHPIYGGDEAFMLVRGETFSQDLINQVWADYYGNDPEHPAPAARLRTDSLWSFDLNLQYPIQFGSSTVHLYLDVFNLFNSQTPTVFDETYTQDPADASQLVGLPEEQIAYNPDGTLQFTPYSDYLVPTAFQAPMRARFGAKFSF